LIVVTHDRSLMARLATRVIEVSDGRVTLYPGGYDDYEAARLARAKEPARAGSPAREAPALPPGRAGEPAPPAARAAAKEDRRGAAAHEQARRTQAVERKRTREVERLGRDIEVRETKMRELESQLADPQVYQDGSRTRDLVTRYERLRAEVESLWQRLGEL
jgi:ATP-binding cassette subfamily F protein 3